MVGSEIQSQKRQWQIDKNIRRQDWCDVKHCQQLAHCISDDEHNTISINYFSATVIFFYMLLNTMYSVICVLFLFIRAKR